jgi:CRP-like cAMP-binding protein
MLDMSTHGHRDNRLLAALPSEVFDLMRHDLRQISLAQRQAIYEPGAPIEEIYFPQSGIISLLVVSKDGGAVETATIGREGAVGLHGALGKRLSFSHHASRRQVFSYSRQRFGAPRSRPRAAARLDHTLYRGALGRGAATRGL